MLKAFTAKIDIPDDNIKIRAVDIISLLHKGLCVRIRIT